jgi:hypothetical protein
MKTKILQPGFTSKLNQCYVRGTLGAGSAAGLNMFSTFTQTGLNAPAPFIFSGTTITFPTGVNSGLYKLTISFVTTTIASGYSPVPGTGTIGIALDTSIPNYDLSATNVTGDTSALFVIRYAVSNTTSSPTTLNLASLLTGGVWSQGTVTLEQTYSAT